METKKFEDTCKVYKVGTGLCISIRKQYIDALGIKAGDLLKVAFETTGLNLPKRKVKKNDTEICEVQ